MNEKNIQLTKRVIRELAKNEAILQGARIDVHREYSQPDPSLEGDFLDMRDWITENECGTAACLAGWMAQDPRVQAAGLKLEEDSDGRLQPMFARSQGMWAMRRFLGFDEISNVNYIFGASHPNTFASALVRLDEAVAREKELIHA